MDHMDHMDHMGHMGMWNASMRLLVCGGLEVR